MLTRPLNIHGPCKSFTFHLPPLRPDRSLKPIPTANNNPAALGKYGVGTRVPPTGIPISKRIIHIQQLRNRTLRIPSPRLRNRQQREIPYEK